MRRTHPALVSALVLAAAASMPEAPPPAAAQTPVPTLPKSARGNGPRNVGCSNKPSFDRAAQRRRRKLAKDSRRANRRRA